MRKVALACILIGAGFSVAAVQKKAAKKPEPAKPVVPALAKPAGFATLALDPINPHYFRFRGRTTVFITSGEHYGAILNARFDYLKYLDALSQDHLNLARIFNGTYLETLDSTVYRGGDQNTLAPTSENYLAPWVHAGNQFDLTKWDERYFVRLKSFVAEAGKRNIAVEVTLFSVNYGSGKGGWGSWNRNPLNAANNVNRIGAVNWDRFTTSDDIGLVTAQEALVKRTVTELNGFDNLYYEICNEPYFSGATGKQTEAWSNRIAAAVKQTESKLPNQHLIAENVANGFAVIKDVNPAVSIFNFHYASPPAAVPLNWGLKKPLAFDETSNGCVAVDRRREAWAFAFSGGAVYDNLDPSFATGDPTGTGQVKASDQAYNCSEIRYQLGVLQTFLRRFDLQFMQPNANAVRQWPLGASDAYVLSEPGRTYALYLKASGNRTKQSMLIMDLPPGRYQPEWLNPRTGDTDKADVLEHLGGLLRIVTPDYTEDLAMRLVRMSEMPSVPKPVRPRRL